MREVKCLIQTHISARGIFTIIIIAYYWHITEILVKNISISRKLTTWCANQMF